MLRTTLLLASLALPVSSQGSLWIVDIQGAPGAHFNQIQPAVDVAQSGDTILVRGGAGGSFVVDGKGLTVVTESGAYASCTVRNVPAGETVLVRGLNIVWASAPVAQVEDNEGEVWFEDCEWSFFGNGLIIEDSSSVTFARCVAEGIGTGYVSLPLRVQSSDVRMFDSRVEVLGVPIDSSYIGATAVSLSGGNLWLDGCTVKGGKGFDSDFGLGPFPTNGGTGILVTDGGQLSTRACSIWGGAGGVGWFPASPGQPIVLASGTHVALGGAARTVSLPVGPLVGGTPAAVTATAPAGELVLLLVGFDVNPRPVPGLPDALLPASPMFFIHAGTVPSGGVLSLPISPPDLGPGFPALNLVAQGLFLTAAPAWVLGQASASSLVSLP